MQVMCRLLLLLLELNSTSQIGLNEYKHVSQTTNLMVFYTSGGVRGILIAEQEMCETSVN